MSKPCAVSGKRKYQSALVCMLDNARRPIMARSYRCPDCGFWHLTRKSR